MNDSLPTTLTVETNNEEDREVSSWNHGWTQSQLWKTFIDFSDYAPNIELSLDISKVDLSPFDLQAKTELKPDVCLYPATRRGRRMPNDILKMSEMPLLVAEILSPKQGMYEVIEKFKAYFFLGVKSCWLVMPQVEIVTVYDSIENFKTFGIRSGDTEVIDDTLKLRIPLEKIFN